MAIASRVKVSYQENVLSPPVAWAYVRSKTVVLFLLIHCLACSHCLWGFVFGPFVFIHYLMSF